MLRNLWLLSVCWLVVACHKDDPPPPPPDNTIDYFLRGHTLGEATTGEAVVSTLQGDELGRREILAAGMYNLQLFDMDRDDIPVPFRVRWTAGEYTEDADAVGVSISPSDELSVVFLGRENQFPLNNINYYSSIATGRALYNFSVNDFQAASIDMANNTVRGLFGYDHNTTNGTKPSQEVFADQTDAEKLMGLVHAGISQLTLDWSMAAGQASRQAPYTTARFISTALWDVGADGVLDGLGAGGTPLMIGSQAIDTNTYRHEIAISMIRFLENPNNVSGLTKEEVLPFALLINDDDVSDLYGGSAIVPIDEGGAVITNFTPAEGATVSGDAMLSVDLVDTTGIDRVEFFIDGVHYTYASVPISAPLSMTATFPFSVPVFQPAGTSGIHTVKVEVTNVNGTVTSQTNNNVTFDNL